MKSAIQLVLMMVWCASAVALPENDYICKVQTVGVKLGVVFVQAEDRVVAAQIASDALAKTIDGGEQRAQLTLECIDSNEERFQDKEFDNFVRNIPR